MGKKHPSIAKITRPVITKVYPRKRLFRLLDKITDSPVIWISGPGGAGKTTLVSSYIDINDLPCLWYRMDSGDSDLASFFYYMGMAGRKAAPRKRKPLPLLTPEYLPGIQTFTKRYFENLFSRLIPKRPPFKSPLGKGGFVVVLDNYQELPEDSNFHGIICSGLEAIPEGIRVIIMSRREPPKEMACLRARKTVQIIGWEEMRLTLEETKGVMKLSGQKGLSKEIIEQFQDRMHGWVGGMVLLLERAKQEEIGTLLEDLHAPEEIFDYFAGEIFNRTDRKTQDFLLKTSFLQEIVPSIAEKLTGIERADRILSSLYNDNFFIERRLLSSGKVYRYHPLFREFLMTKANEHFELTERTQISQRAGQLLEESGDIEGAAELFIQAGDLQGLIPLIMKNAQTLAMQGRSTILEYWLRSIPDEIVNSTSWLLFWLGMCRMPLDLEESRELFEKVFKLSYEQKDAALVFLSWTGVVQSIMFKFDSFKLLDPWISRLDALVKEFGAIPPGEIETRLTSAMHGALVFRQPGHSEFDMWKDRAIKLSNESGDISLKASAFASQFYYTFFSGTISEMHEVILALKAHSKDMTPLGQLHAKLDEAGFLNVSVKKEECISIVENALKFAEESGVHVMDFFLMYNAAWACISTGDTELAGTYIRRMEQMPGRHGSWYKTAYYQIHFLEMLEKGNLQAARESAKQFLDSQRPSGEMNTECNALLCNSLIQCELGNFSEATEYISEVKSMTDFRYHKFQRLLMEAHLAFKQQDDRHGLECLNRGMALGNECGYMNLILWNSSMMSGLCMKALEAGIEVEYVLYPYT